MNGCSSQSVAANQNSTSSTQITLLVNRFMLKRRHLLLLETCRFSMATLCYRNTQQNSVEKVAYTTCSLDYKKVRVEVSCYRLQNKQTMSL